MSVGMSTSTSMYIREREENGEDVGRARLRTRDLAIIWRVKPVTP